jgi:hypothetical protein
MLSEAFRTVQSGRSFALSARGRAGAREAWFVESPWGDMACPS